MIEITADEWYKINNVDQIDSPCLVVYKERVKANIDLLVSMVNEVSRLRPHIKTCKAIEPAKMMIESGVTKFKCATIAEAEMLGIAGAQDVLLAYQLVGPKVSRFIELIAKYPSTRFTCLIDDLQAAQALSIAITKAAISVNIYIDLNVGMNRTGILPNENAFQLYKEVSLLKGIAVKGLHAYDGHIHDVDMQFRADKTNSAFAPVDNLIQQLNDAGFHPVLIAGGSPTFAVHAKQKDIECSPGTFIYWDKGYSDNMPEQAFLPAALLLTRVVSLPRPTTICLDIGHKAVASENSLDKRVFFVNAPSLKVVGHSEEHMMIDAGENHPYEVGDVLYAMPYHICPTVALHQFAITIEQNNSTDKWNTVARDRFISL